MENATITWIYRTQKKLHKQCFYDGTETKPSHSSKRIHLKFYCLRTIKISSPAECSWEEDTWWAHPAHWLASTVIRTPVGAGNFLALVHVWSEMNVVWFEQRGIYTALWMEWKIFFHILWKAVSNALWRWPIQVNSSRAVATSTSWQLLMMRKERMITKWWPERTLSNGQRGVSVVWTLFHEHGLSSPIFRKLIWAFI